MQWCDGRQGLKDSQIVVHGLPIRPQFSQRLPRKEVLRKKLGMLQSAPTVAAKVVAASFTSLERCTPGSCPTARRNSLIG